MSKRDYVRRTARHGKPVLVIDFWYFDSDGARKRFRRDATAQTRGAARAEAERLIALAARTGSPVAKRPVPTFAQFVASTYRPVFMAKHRPATQQRYEDLFRQGVLAEFGRMPLDAVGYMAVQAFASKLTTRDVQPRGPCNLIRSVLRAAEEAGLLEAMPRLPTFRPSSKLPDAPSADYVAALLLAATGWVKVAAALTAYAGLRQGEVRALAVGDIRFDQAKIVVRQAFSGGKVVTPKGKRERVVPLIPELAELLRSATRNKLPSAFVLTNRNGTVPSRQAVLTAIKRTEERAGLSPRSHHSLRHFFGSGLLHNGVSVEAVRVLLGHADLATTARYVHATIDEGTSAAISRLAGNRLERRK